MKRKLVVIVLLAFVSIQFIRPEKNRSNSVSTLDISRQYEIPAKVKAILDRACNDCHSNNTHYPWYSQIQPIGWWIRSHIIEGKEELNFSEFGNYPPKLQYGRMMAIVGTVKEGFMPLKSYTWTHHDAVLAPHEKKLIYDWAGAIKKQLADKYGLTGTD